LGEERISGLRHINISPFSSFKIRRKKSQKTDKLGQFRRPQTGRDDFFNGNPVGVNVGERLGCSATVRSVETADEYAVGIEEIFNGSPFSKELGRRKDPSERFFLSVKPESVRQ
jgi:hypothetical protein